MHYSKFILSASIVISALVGITAASAADLGPRTYTKAPSAVVDPSYNWSGFGLNAGGEWSRSNAADHDGIQPRRLLCQLECRSDHPRWRSAHQ